MIETPIGLLAAPRPRARFAANIGDSPPSMGRIGQ